MHANYLDPTGCVLVTFWEDGSVNLAVRADPGYTWGPPIPLSPERGYPTIVGAIFGAATGDKLIESIHGPVEGPRFDQPDEPDSAA